jgi:hypothetical protein
VFSLSLSLKKRKEKKNAFTLLFHLDILMLFIEANYQLCTANVCCTYNKIRGIDGIIFRELFCNISLYPQKKKGIIIDLIIHYEV